jgi:hypothetical protein
MPVPIHSLLRHGASKLSHSYVLPCLSLPPLYGSDTGQCPYGTLLYHSNTSPFRTMPFAKHPSALPFHISAVHRFALARLCFTYQCHSLAMRCIAFPQRFSSIRCFAVSVQCHSETALCLAFTARISTTPQQLYALPARCFSQRCSAFTKRCVAFPMRVRSFPLLNFTIPIRY